MVELLRSEVVGHLDVGWSWSWAGSGAASAAGVPELVMPGLAFIIFLTQPSIRLIMKRSQRTAQSRRSDSVPKDRPMLWWDAFRVARGDDHV